MRAVIMAGGKGTRLASLNASIPKPMFPVLGKPILEYQIESLVKSKINDITIIVGHLKEVVVDYFRDGHKFGVKINYIEENEPLGTAGALYYLKEEKDDFVLVFGDLILDIDFNRFMDFHKSHDGAITLFGHPNVHPYDSDVIEVNMDSRVTGILSKEVERDFYYHNFVNAGVYCINPRALKNITALKKIDLEKTIVTELMKQGQAYAYKSTEYVKDMGTPKRLEAVIADVKNGIVKGRSLKQKQKAIFLDRDGTTNELAKAVKSMNASIYLTIAVTNQPVIDKGEVGFNKLDEIHKKIETELAKEGAYFDDFFFCKYHLEKAYEGKVAEQKTESNCRREKIRMLEDVADKYNIDLSQSWYISNETTDIQMGINVGMRTILVKTGEDGQDGNYHIAPDYIAKDLMDAVMHTLG